MTVQECLTDELEYLNELKGFFQKTKYEIMVIHVQKRINEVEKKISSIQPESDTIY